MDTSIERIISEYKPLRSPMAKNNGSQKATPFVQWVGGKRKLIHEFAECFPTDFNNYFEPFVGGGSVYFYLANKFGNKKEYTLLDINEELVITYNQVKKDPTSIIKLLEEFNCRHSKEFYYAIRNIDREKLSTKRYKKIFDITTTLSAEQIAARFLYLNKTCFNAIYRVNKEGLMNVPMGRSENKNILDSSNLHRCSNLLKDTQILHKDYSQIESLVKKGDLVYFDPPYDPISATSAFTDYTQQGFTFEDQIKLCKIAQSLKDKGAFVYVSNSGSKRIRDLYQEWNIKEFYVKRGLNSKAELRSVDVSELLFF